jgi:hypothetical protein
MLKKNIFLWIFLEGIKAHIPEQNPDEPQSENKDPDNTKVMSFLRIFTYLIRGSILA